MAVGAAGLDERMRRYLASPRLAVLATLNRDGSPHLSVVWYDVRGDEIVINTTTTRVKARNLARDPRASILIGESERYVRLDGRARAVATGSAALEDIRSLAIRYEGPDAAERNVRELWSKQERLTLALTIADVYAYGFE
jgi:PPOX class probable F420-dependent enzyme